MHLAKVRTGLPFAASKGLAASSPSVNILEVLLRYRQEGGRGTGRIQAGIQDSGAEEL